MTRERLKLWEAGTLRGADLTPEEHEFLLQFFKTKLADAARALRDMPEPMIPFIPRPPRRRLPRKVIP